MPILIGMSRGKFLLGFLWALPVTLTTFLFYILPFWVLGWYTFLGWRELAWVWLISDHAPASLQKSWMRWAGQCVGNLVVLKYHPEKTERGKMTLVHELEHVKQVMRLGIFQPILYFFIAMAGKALDNADGYYDNIFEIDARRKANQIVDVVGLTKKIQESSKKG